MQLDRDHLDRIREAISIEDVVGKLVRLRRAGRGMVGCCPFHDERTPSFHVSDDRGTYHCFGCGAHGDVFRFVQETEGVGFLEALRMLEADAGLTGDAIVKTPSRRPERIDRAIVESGTAAQMILDGARSARGTIVEAWLEARGIAVDRVAPALDHLRFHPACPIAVWEVAKGPQSVPHAPAMVAPIADADGVVLGAHVTWLSPDGRSKAQLRRRDGSERPSRKMFGQTARAGCFLTGTDGPGPLVVGEGIETVLSYCAALEGPWRALAVLSLQNLQGRAQRDERNAVPLWRLAPATEGMPMTLPSPGEVAVLVDADMKPVEMLVQRERGGRREKVMISQAERADICATLAVQAWRLAGGRPVRAYRPPLGMDFNDLGRSG